MWYLRRILDAIFVCFPRAIYQGVGWRTSEQVFSQAAVRFLTAADSMPQDCTDAKAGFGLWDGMGCSFAGPLRLVDDTRLYCTLYIRMHPSFSEDSFRRGCLIAACMRRFAAQGRAGISTSMLSSNLLTRLYHLCTDQRQRHRGTRGTRVA